MSQHNLEQMVRKVTRGHRVLDVFLTNCPHIWKPPVVFNGLVRSDHLAVMVTPRVAARPDRSFVFFRDVREHRKIQMEHKLEACVWNNVLSCDDITEAIHLLDNTLTGIFNECFPLIKVKVSSRDPPYMSPLVKHLCTIRNRNIRKYGEVNTDLQTRINELIRYNQVQAVRNENREYGTGTKGWWNTVNKITGRESKASNISSVINPEGINLFFQRINTETQYSAPELLPIPEGTRVPTLDVLTVRRFMTRLKRTAPGPDGFPYWLWRDFAHHLAPVVTKLFNSSLRQQSVPLPWKLANISPIPKESPLSSCAQLRPISLTNIIMRLFERLVCNLETFMELRSVIGMDQFAYKKHCNTTMALIKCQHHWLRWLDNDVDFVRVLSFDFSKAFDTVSHKIVCEKLKATNLNPYIINWIISFLGNRKQRVVVDGKITDYVDINRGVPQGTVLGPLLFSLMVNDIKLVDSNNGISKYADDITISVPVRKNSDTALTEVKNLESWAANNRMSLNLPKTWEMLLRSRTTQPAPPPVPGIERKECLKLLGITFHEDPCNWDLHVDSLLSRAASRLYILRVCKYYGYPKDQLSKLFDSLIMSLFLYGLEVWGSAYQGKYLDRIDTFFRRAYRFGYTNKITLISDVIKNRDSDLFNRITSDTGHVLYDLLPPKRNRALRKRGHDFILPKVKTERFKRAFVNICLFKFIS